MNEHFIYSVLKYQYSQVLGEVLNVGLLAFFADEWRFIYPQKLTRLKELYPDVEENHIKTYLQSFEKHSQKLSDRLQQEIDFEQFSISDFEQKIKQEFLIKDDSALQFSEAKTSVKYSNNIDKISQNLYQKYFFPYDISQEKRKDEEFILKELKILLKENQGIYNKYFQNQESKKISNEKTTLKVDLHWKNGQTHLVQPLNFDLKKETSIDNKANRYFGKLIQLQSEIEKGQYIIDIPLAKPSEKRLFKYYDRATRILSDAPATNLIEEDKLQDYAEDTIRQLILHKE